MKLQFAIVIGAILVGSIATVNMAFVSDESFSANTLKSSAGMLGHVTLTATNEDGNIIAYRQTDNVVINQADDCIMDHMFDTSISACSETNNYNDVAIGTQSATFTEASTALGTFHAATGGTTSSGTAASGTQGAQVTVTAAFLDVGTNIGEAALQNGPLVGNDKLALQKFTPISLGANDDLTIEWTVTIDGN